MRLQAVHAILLSMDYHENLFGSAVILSGGKSSRFGENKALAPFGGIRMIDFIIGQLKLLFDDIIIVSNQPEQYSDTGVKVIPDIIKNAGPLGGVHSGLKAAGSRYVFITACDMPYISKPLIMLMEDVILKNRPEAAAASPGGFTEPFHAFYSAALSEKIENSSNSGAGSIFGLIQNSNACLITDSQLNSLMIKGEFFRSINSKKDLADRSAFFYEKPIY